MSDIKGILEIINSKRDMYGNCYYAFRFTDVSDGNTVEGTISGGDSNLRATERHLFPEGARVVYATTTELPIRQYNRLVKTWRYAGCQPEEIAAFIRRDLAAARLGTKQALLVYPEIHVNKGEVPTFPVECPVCKAARVASIGCAGATYACGGAYTFKVQIQNHTDKYWGACGKK